MGAGISPRAKTPPQSSERRRTTSRSTTALNRAKDAETRSPMRASGVRLDDYLSDAGDHRGDLSRGHAVGFRKLPALVPVK